MVLRNKDGSPYKLSGPNPVMNNQDVWADFQLHNMNWEPENKKDNTPKIEPEIIEDNFLNALNEAKKEVKKEIIKEKPPEKPKIEKTFIHCLPAKIREKKDSLYGDVYRTIQYENPTSFEGIILEEQDLTLNLWTDLEFGIGSILYPKMQTKRWWRIQTIIPKANGWLITATPSDYQPSFEG